MLVLLSVLMFLVPAAFSMLIHSCLRHGEVETKRKIFLFVLYLVIINLLTFAISFVRGVRTLDFTNMTMSYRLKYIGLGCTMGFLLPFAVCLATEDIITIGGFKRYITRFLKDMRKYLPYALWSAKADLQAEVASSYLNWMWWLIEPVCNMVIYTIIFGVVFNVAEQYFSIFVFIGLTMWGFFSRTVSGSVDLLRMNKDIITKVYMPKYIILLSKMFVNFFKMMVSFVVIVIMMVFFRVPVNSSLLWCVPVFIILFMFTFGVSTIMLHYGVYVNDLGYITGILLQMMMYFTGVFYSIANQAPEPFGVILETFNPMAFFISAMRGALIYRTSPAVSALGVWSIVSLVTMMLGIFTIYSNENSYVKVL